ncbi:hypothetical protein BG57_22825 [Caballeronia grimmiae]|uniref:Uncharacterized protein n=2 Tax=Caballeronia grimmiae TaxID=1071679 RepID=A0A069NRI2_9BURK|nr:hypothetical protein BG57_22825 [Caballeronia grimmiae]
MLLRRLWKVVMPAPPELRLDFLTSNSGALENRMPIDLLKNDREYRTLRAFAKAQASGFSRTFVNAFTADVSEGLAGREPLSTCATEIDPRHPPWKRALEAVRAPGLPVPARQGTEL